MRTKQYVAIAAGVGLSAGLFAAMPAMAQSGQPSRAAPQAAMKATNVSDAQIQKYVAAQAQVKRIATKWQSKIKNAKNKKTALQYRRQANKAMVQAVKSSGLSITEYNRITRAAQSNKELAKRIQNAR